MDATLYWNIEEEGTFKVEVRIVPSRIVGDFISIELKKVLKDGRCYDVVEYIMKPAKAVDFFQNVHEAIVQAVTENSQITRVK